MSDQQLLDECRELRFRAKGGERRDRLIAPMFAIVQEASHRALGMRHFDVQLKAGINLAEKCVVEMATGEGKTLTAVLPLALHALRGKGAHLATANDYLARRDAEEMRAVFERIGMSTGIIQHEDTDDDRNLAYRKDVTYGTLSELGFDFLRDRMKARVRRHTATTVESESSDGFSQPVCRRLHFVLVDEADSIMIDDASTPLIIGAVTSATDERKSRLFQWAAKNAAIADAVGNYRYIEHLQKVELTEKGRRVARNLAVTSNVADQPSVDLYEYLERGIKVRRNYVRDRNYVLNNGEATIVDENTGRLAVGRFWQDGLHQAIQAHEGLKITVPTASAARLTIQSLVLSYPHRAGMTGTARSSRREFRKVYKMSVIRIPTNKRCRRKKLPTVVAENERSKMERIRDDVMRLREEGRPVLIGSRSVSKSETLSELFSKAGIAHEVLNARHEAAEAEIVARAGTSGTVTISTSMAGRGTDIKLDDIAISRGGLHVLITELNDSKRVDRQLIGRCARQGDPGTYRTYLAFDDHVMDPKNQTQWWLYLAKRFPFLPRPWFFRCAQRQINAKKMRDRLAMLHNEKKRLRALRQAGFDPVLDVVG